MQRSTFSFYDWHFSGEMQELMDYANQKFDNENWRSYGDWDVPQMSKSWNVMVDEYTQATRPVMLAPLAEKPIMDTTGFEWYSGRIPKMGHAIQFMETDIQEFYELDIPQGALLDKIREKWYTKMEACIQGFHTELNCMTYQALSTGMLNYTASGTNSIPVQIDYRVPAKHKLKALKQKWFSDTDWTPNENADPIKDLKRMCKIADNDGVPYDHFEMSKDLYDNFLMHPKVTAAVQARLVPAAASTTIYPMNNQEIVDVLMKVFSIPVIIPIEEKSKWNKLGVIEEAKPSFEKNTVVLVQSGQFFRIKNSPSMYLQDTNPAVRISSLEGERIAFLHQYSSEPYAEKSSGELWACPVMKNPNNLIIMKVDEQSNSGL